MSKPATDVLSPQDQWLQAIGVSRDFLLQPRESCRPDFRFGCFRASGHCATGPVLKSIAISLSAP